MQIELARRPRRPASTEKTEPLWAGAGLRQAVLHALSRDMNRLDVCVADTATGEVKPLIQERMNVYIESKPLKVINNGSELVWWSERDGWGHYYLYGADGTLKNQITQGEFVAEDIAYVDEKAAPCYLTASGRERRRGSLLHALLPRQAGRQRHEAARSGRRVARRQHDDSGKYFIDTFSRVNTAPEVGAVRRAGRRRDAAREGGRGRR